MPSGVFSQNYRQELALRRGAFNRAAALSIAALAILLPFVLSTRWMTIGVFAIIAAIGALGLHILTGLAGQVSLGHAAFLAVGAYAAIWLGVDHGMPMWVWLPGAGAAAALLGAVSGPLAVRLRGLYLAVVTLALVFITQYVWNVATGLTGGFNGRPAMRVYLGDTELLRGISVFGLDLTGNQTWWFFSLGFLVIGAYAAVNLGRTRMGRAFTSIRERDLAASVAGIPVTRTKTIAFIVSSFYAGVAGALLAAYQSYVVPDQWGLLLSIEYIAMIVIGGLGSVSGAILGAVFVTAIPQLVHELAAYVPFIVTRPRPTGGISVELLAHFLYGLTIVAVLVFEPRGIMGLWERFKLIWKTWPWSYQKG
jgi:branched-chain amino acid transport system permease protein